MPGSGSFFDRLTEEAFEQSATSLLQAPGRATVTVTIRADGDPVTLVARTNDQGRVASIETGVEAANYFDAEAQTFNAVAPTLSQWAFLADAAVEVRAVRIQEHATLRRRWAIGVLGRAKPFAPASASTLTTEQRRLLAAYREALSATSVFYQALCFYKVVEGVFKLRTVRRARAVSVGETPSEPSERFPDDMSGWLAGTGFQETAFFDPYRGKKFTAVRDTLRKTLRNALAHLDPDGEVVDTDQYAGYAVCANSLPVLRHMARVMLMSELDSAFP